MTRRAEMADSRSTRSTTAVLMIVCLPRSMRSLPLVIVPISNGTLSSGNCCYGCHMDADAIDGLSIDELAREAGSSVRNVRLYQERGLLPKPRREGRRAVYGRVHVERLKLILELLERGYPIAAIKELIDAWES